MTGFPRRALMASVGLLCTVTSSITAQTERAIPSSDTLSPLVLDTFEIADGLPSGTVLDIAQTPDGYLWLATDSGLARFDGLQFATFSSSNMPGLEVDWIQALAVGQEGSLWIAPRTGPLLRYRRGATVSYGPSEGLPLTAEIRLLHVGPGGTIWIGTAARALYRFTGDRISRLAIPRELTPDRFASMHEDQDGVLWIAGVASGLYRYERGSWRVYAADAHFDGRPVRSVLRDGAGVLWIGTDGAGLYRQVDGAFVEMARGLSQRFPDMSLHLMLGDRFGDLWLGPSLRVSGGRVARLDLGGQLSASRARVLFEDQEGSLWIGSAQTGLARLRRSRFAQFGRLDGARVGSALFETSDGILWAGGRDGLSRLGPGGFASASPDDDTASAGPEAVFSIAADASDGLWLGTARGLVHRSATGSRTFTVAHGLPYNAVGMVYSDPAGGLWAATRPRGLTQIIDGRLIVYEALAELEVSVLHRDRAGDLWVGTRPRGLARWDGTTLEPVTNADGPWPHAATAIHEDRENNIWVATLESGLHRFHSGRETVYDTTAGVPRDTILSVLEDDDRRLWLGTDAGIFRIDKRRIEDYDRGLIARIPHRAYTRKDGLRSSVLPVNGHPRALRRADGSLWFAVLDGVAATDPRRRTETPCVPIIIEQVMAERPVYSNHWARREHAPERLRSDAEPREAGCAGGTPGEFSIPLGQRTVGFHFAVPSLANQDRLRYRYQLLGYDPEWVEAGSQRFAYYSNLLPGRYKFRVAARLSEQAWADTGAEVVVVLPNLYYETGWFRGLILAGLVAGGIGVARGIRSARRRAEDLERVVVQRDRSLEERDQSQEELQRALHEVRSLTDRLEHENVYLRSQMTASHGFADVIGESDAMRTVLHQVEQVAASDATVLILGETGSGKEVIAHAIHSRSARNERPLVTVNCTALPGPLIESEMFGHEKGAFTGAGERRHGRFELADGGTLLLDEIGDLDSHLQTKLLRVLETGEFERVGGTRTLRVDVRILAATNRNLENSIRQKRFRPDLYYRLNVFPISLPPLRERRDDIPLLTWYFVDRFASQAGKSFESIPRPLMDALLSYDWPGNVRELRNVIERAVVLSPGPTLKIDEPFGASVLSMTTTPSSGDAGEEPVAVGTGTLEDVERAYILRVLDRLDWKVRGEGGAARALGLKESTLRSRMKKLGIVRPT